MKSVVVFILAFLVSFQASLAHACGSNAPKNEDAVKSSCHQTVQHTNHHIKDIFSDKVEPSHASCPYCVTQSCELKEFLFTKTAKESTTEKSSKLIYTQNPILFNNVKSIARVSSNYFPKASVPKNWQALYSVFII